MKLTKLGHSCILLEAGSVRVLVAPGDYTTAAVQAIKNIDAGFITHEHVDHFDLPSLKSLRTIMPDVPIYTNHGVGARLDAEKISWQLCEHNGSIKIKDLAVVAYGEQHGAIYPTVPVVVNTGYLFGGKFFHPGDAFIVPPFPVDVLALPIVAPWLKIDEVIEYAKSVKPRICFSVHDGPMKSLSFLYTKLIPSILEPLGITYILLGAGESLEV